MSLREFLFTLERASVDSKVVGLVVKFGSVKPSDHAMVVKMRLRLCSFSLS